ncbi:cyclase [Mycolicibacterium cosmeticum]|uniref:GAF domain-containing protein n=1 Tax=Mycolicibacterium cosmeticum TaxID=258533 RepID=W9BLL0_MYCCO|nr:AAA family ATPase [Mycolicibacterium cosmeticum]TLH74515.1 cyclase [Mycolicibacterium cosmeticum]CDO09835.1 GAF domain-containing protein [Mycolicibacterium cosmeticum]
MTTPVLDFDGRVVDRRQELTDLRAAVESAGRAAGSCVLISGVSGVGKSTLVQAFGAEVAERNCVFAYGRCRDGAPAPYTALGEALGALVRTMESTPAAERNHWRSALISATPPLSDVLGDLVPELRHISTTDAAAPGPVPQAADMRRRLHRAVIALLSETAAFRPVVLTIDDLQWADGDSLLFLSELLTVSLRNVLVVGAHRAGEFDPTETGLTASTIKRINLAPLSRPDIEELLAGVSGPSVELGDVAREFHHRTDGNPLQVRQLLYRAQQVGALVPAGPEGRPRWDLRILSSIEMSASTAEFLGRYLDQLRPVDRDVLRSLTVIGSEFDLADATAAAAAPPDTVAQTLWTALELRLIEALDRDGKRIGNAISQDARYRFSHDKVKESAREGLSPEDARRTHLRIGRRLLELGDDRLFEAARHVGLGGGAATDAGERLRFVEVLHRAAGKARVQASFPLCLEHCRSALNLLGERRWSTNFDLTLQLQLEAAEAALLVGDVATLHDLLDEAEGVLRDPADRARLAYLRLKGRIAQNRIQEALAIGLRALDELGEPLPPDAGTPRILNALGRMKLTTRRWSTEQLLALRECEDRRVIEVQRILAELRSMSYIARPNLFPLIVRKQLSLSLAHGHTPSTPLVLVSYGVLLAITGDRSGAQRFGEVAVALTERAEFRQARPETLFLYLNFIRHWRHPVRDGLGQVRDAVTAALNQGDQEYAGFLVTVLLAQSFWAGTPTTEIDTMARSLIPQIRSQPVPSTLSQALHQLCLNLLGRSEDAMLVAGESGYDERVIVPAARHEGDEVTLSVAADVKQGLHFWSGDYAGAVAVTEDVMRHLAGTVGTSTQQLVHMVNALSRIHSAPGDRATRSAVRESLALHRKWAAEAPANYAAPCALVEGAWARARGRYRDAERFLDTAIELADEHQLPLIGALAHEEAAELYTDTGRARLHEHMLRSAYQRWLALGFTLRVNRLARRHPWLLSRELVQPGARIDPVGAHHLVRTLAAARTPDSLAKLTLGAAADMTGADRVLCLTGEPDQLTVRAVHQGGITTTIDDPWTEVPYDTSVVHRVIETGAPLCLTSDTSILAAPIRLQDKTIGVLYAERTGPGPPFCAQHEEAMTFLCAQAAAPLLNFQLEAQLRAADEHRQSLMDVQSRFVPNELLRMLDIDDVRRVHSGYRVERHMTVLISDIRGYTTLLEDMDVLEANTLATGFLRAVELPIVACNGMIQDMRGDEILAVFEGSPDDAVRAGLGMLRSLREHNGDRLAHGSEELRVGIGINSGVVGLGLVGGVNRMVLSTVGDAVNLAARIEGTTKRYDSALLISDATYAELSDPTQFCIRRMERVMVVNRRQPVTVYEVYDEDPQDLRAAKLAAQPTFDEAFDLFDGGDVDKARAAFERCHHLLPDDAVATLHIAHCDAIQRGELTPGQDVALHQKYAD